MRDIKFRAWNGVDKTYVDWMTLCGMPRLITNVARGNEKHYALEQYTGLKDKNGVEIYEGDIVKSEQEKHYWMSVISIESGLGGVNLYAMEFCNNVSISECGGLYTYERQLSVRRNNIHSRMEVIGNIHENPELLK